MTLSIRSTKIRESFYVVFILLLHFRVADYFEDCKSWHWILRFFDFFLGNNTPTYHRHELSQLCHVAVNGSGSRGHRNWTRLGATIGKTLLKEGEERRELSRGGTENISV
jgi:hypothetical protein